MARSKDNLADLVAGMTQTLALLIDGLQRRVPADLTDDEHRAVSRVLDDLVQAARRLADLHKTLRLGS